MRKWVAGTMIGLAAALFSACHAYIEMPPEQQNTGYTRTVTTNTTGNATEGQTVTHTESGQQNWGP